MNIGMRLAFLRGADWCLLFNYYAEIEPHALTHLVSVAQGNSRAGLLSPVIYGKDKGSPWFAKGKIEFFRMRATHRTPSVRELSSDFYASEFLTGCSLLVKKELVDKIGFLDERFFLYYEDADYSLRAAKAGFDCLVVSKARAWHSERSEINPEKMYFLVYSGLLFFEKHTPYFWRPYMMLYGTIRRVKNFLDRTCKKSIVAEEVHRAYKNFFHEH